MSNKGSKRGRQSVEQRQASEQGPKLGFGESGKSIEKKKHEITLAVPQAIDAANLIVIGQLAVLYSNVLFQLATAWLSGTSPDLNRDAWLVIVLVLLVPPIIFINILSGWVSTRSTFEEFEEYPNSIFMLDVLMVAVFFMMINIISFSVLPSGTSNYLSALIFSRTQSIASEQSAGVSPLESSIVQVLPPFIYVCSGIILALYLAWNKYHALEREKITGNEDRESGIVGFNFLLSTALIVHIFLSLVSMFVESVVVEFVCAIVWATMWLFLNGYWLVKSPLSLSSKKGE